MKKFSLKFVVVSFAIVIGVISVWVSGGFQFLASSLAKSFSHPTEKVMPTIKPPAGEKSGKVLIQFKSFEEGKDWNADFEITNDTSLPITYVGCNDKYKDCLCTLGVKTNKENRGPSYKVTNLCWYSTALFLQTLEPSESTVFSISKQEVRELLYLDSTETETRAQLGFEVFVGAEKHREILWSEEIRFPDDQ